jgi:hypothetical protein
MHNKSKDTMARLRRVAQTGIACALYCIALLLFVANWAIAQPMPPAHVDLQLVLALDASGQR